VAVRLWLALNRPDRLGHQCRGAMMRGNKAVLSLLAASGILVASVSMASANLVFDWQGTCGFGCTGIATGVLTLTSGGPFNFDTPLLFDHTYGNPQFVSFTYSSSSGTYTLDNTPPGLYALGYIAGQQTTFLESDELGPQLPDTPLFQFVTFLGLSSLGIPDSWQFLFGTYGTATVRDGGVGVSSFFTEHEDIPPPPTPVPAPGSLPLFASGLALLGWLAWRNKAAIQS
jgi:hypothetical protein